MNRGGRGRKWRHAWVLALLAFGAAGVRAQDAPDDTTPGEADFELTITLLPRGATPEAIMRRIELPPPAPAPEDSPSTEGLDTANEAREQRAAGLENAVDAIERGREFGQALREQARETRENAGRGAPPDPPDPPNRPDNPGPPPRP